jgi:hypothetical protein
VPKIPTLFSLDRDLLEWLKAEAAKRRMSMAHIVRDLIFREMKSQPKATDE